MANEHEIYDDIIAPHIDTFKQIPPTDMSLARAALTGFEVAKASDYTNRNAIVQLALDNSAFGHDWLNNQHYGVFAAATFFPKAELTVLIGGEK